MHFFCELAASVRYLDIRQKCLIYLLIYIPDNLPPNSPWTVDQINCSFKLFGKKCAVIGKYGQAIRFRNEMAQVKYALDLVSGFRRKFFNTFGDHVIVQLKCCKIAHLYFVAFVLHICFFFINRKSLSLHFCTVLKHLWFNFTFVWTQNV